MAYTHSVKYFNTFDSTFCSTYTAENQTVYSDCQTLSTSCKVYYNSILTQPVTVYSFIKFGGVVHEMNFNTGEINLVTPIQCPIPEAKIYRVTIPANTIKAGQIFTMNIWGYMNSVATTNFIFNLFNKYSDQALLISRISVKGTYDYFNDRIYSFIVDDSDLQQTLKEVNPDAIITNSEQW
mgnify:CR=1 FL=1